MEYTLIRSNRKTLGIYIKDGRVEVRAPLKLSAAVIEAFVEEKRPRIEEKLAQYNRQKRSAEAAPISKEELEELKALARQVIPERAAYFARILGLSFKGITIRAQRSRWGSCSGKGQLNFNCLLMLAPPEVRDSVIVHELCHLKEMNHSKRFYALVLDVMPDYYLRHRWLKENGTAILMRVKQGCAENVKK